MIEKYLIRNDLTLKRYRRFKRNKTALLSIGLLVIISFFSFTAELWSNNKPIVMKYHDKMFFPLVADYRAGARRRPPPRLSSGYGGLRGGTEPPVA